MDPGLGRFAGIARASADVISASIDGPLEGPVLDLYKMAADQRARGDLHYLGITQLNIGEFERARGNHREALTAATEAIASLTASSASHEVPAAQLIRSWALAHQNQMEVAEAELEVAVRSEFRLVRDEVRIEAASILLAYGSSGRARELLGAVGPRESMAADVGDQYRVSLAELDIADGRYLEAQDRLFDLEVEQPHREPGFKARIMTLRAIAATLSKNPDALELARRAQAQANDQGAGRWKVQAELVLALSELPRVPKDPGVAETQPSEPLLSALAELVISSDVPDASPLAHAVELAAKERPERWRPILRRTLTGTNRSARLRAARLLEAVGEADDVALLRSLARECRSGPGSTFGRSLARRVAPRVVIEDLGRVALHIGSRTVAGDSIRRKVLALLCYLITRPDLSATRDQVVDALWPDQDPSAASNSLNQTVYFLRRVFEPTYVDDLSPGYVRHETDLLWLDATLVTAQSMASRRLIDASRGSSSWSTIDLLGQGYHGRFALDFEYEDWSTSYRDNLHAAYLAIIEEAVEDETAAARYDRAIELCRRALDVDPTCEPIERQLLRLYRLTGAHAAAEEQYRHYSTVIAADLGISPPPLTEL